MSDQGQDLTQSGIPQQIGKYEVRSLLGKGAMGIVYRGYDTDIDRFVAIKVLHPNLLEAEFVRRFKQEARAAARCVHRNIVAVFDFGVHDDSPFMVMEYVDGIDLRSFLQNSASLSVRQSCDIILPVLAALEFAHKQGVVHRDIKPGNILLLDDGLVKVADFGVAKLDTSDLTNIGDMIGTPSYMSPEARAGSIVDARADLYTIGVLLLELICGKRPRQVRAMKEETSKLLSGAELNQIDCALFKELFDKALATNPDDRFQTAHEFAEALRAIAAPNRRYEPDTESLAATILETRTIVRQASAIHHPAGASPPSQFTMTIEATTELTQLLSMYLGPVSSYLVRSESQKCQNFDELVSSLSEKIPSQRERSQFVNRLTKKGLRTSIYISGSSPSSGNNPQAAESGPAMNSASGPDAMQFSSEQLGQVTKDLVVYLGPVASRVVKRMARQARDVAQLYNLVAEHIPDADDRDRFLRGK